MPAKFTFDAAQDNSAPIWSPDGTHVAFGSHRKEKWGIYVKVADSTKNEEPVTESDAAHRADDMDSRRADTLCIGRAPPRPKATSGVCR